VHFVYSDFRSLEEIDRCPIEMAAQRRREWRPDARCGLHDGVRCWHYRNVAVAVRDSQAAGKVRGARVIASGQITGPTSGMTNTLPSH
jgi:hypothetical protein